MSEPVDNTNVGFLLRPRKYSGNNTKEDVQKHINKNPNESSNGSYYGLIAAGVGTVLALGGYAGYKSSSENSNLWGTLAALGLLVLAGGGGSAGYSYANGIEAKPETSDQTIDEKATKQKPPEPRPIIEPPTKTDTVEELITKLKNNIPDAQAYLIQKNDPSSIPLLIECLSSTNRDIAISAINVLAFIGDQRALEPLIICLSDPKVGTNAATAIRSIARKKKIEIKEKEKRERLIEALIPYLKNNYTNDTAALILGELKDPIAVEPMITSFWLDERASQFRIETIKALGKIKAPHSVDFLIRIQDPPNVIKKEATYAGEALKEMGDITIVTLINHLINKDELSQRSKELLKSLFNKDDSPESLTVYLTELVKSKDSYVSEQAANDLKKINLNTEEPVQANTVPQDSVENLIRDLNYGDKESKPQKAYSLVKKVFENNEPVISINDLLVRLIQTDQETADSIFKAFSEIDCNELSEQHANALSFWLEGGRTELKAETYENVRKNLRKYAEQIVTNLNIEENLRTPDKQLAQIKLLGDLLTRKNKSSYEGDIKQAASKALLDFLESDNYSNCKCEGAHAAALEALKKGHGFSFKVGEVSVMKLDDDGNPMGMVKAEVKKSQGKYSSTYYLTCGEDFLGYTTLELNQRAKPDLLFYGAYKDFPCFPGAIHVYMMERKNKHYKAGNSLHDIAVKASHIQGYEGRVDLDASWTSHIFHYQYGFREPMEKEYEERERAGETVSSIGHEYEEAKRKKATGEIKSIREHSTGHLGLVTMQLPEYIIEKIDKTNSFKITLKNEVLVLPRFVDDPTFSRLDDNKQQFLRSNLLEGINVSIKVESRKAIEEFGLNLFEMLSNPYSSNISHEIIKALNSETIFTSDFTKLHKEIEENKNINQKTLNEFKALFESGLVKISQNCDALTQLVSITDKYNTSEPCVSITTKPFKKSLEDLQNFFAIST